MLDFLKRWLRRLWGNQVAFTLVNTAFWLGLAWFLLSDRLRLVVGGGLLGALLGGFLIYASFKPSLSGSVGARGPALLFFGLPGLVVGLMGLGVVVWALSGGIPTAMGSARVRIQEALESNQRYLNLNGLGLTALPAELYQLTTLTDLNLADNRLDELPPELCALSNLQRLTLSGNHLVHVPPELACLGKLTELNLARNRLANLPVELGQLAALERLDVAYNRLTGLPPELVGLQRLRWLKLNHNRLHTLPGWLDEMPDLELLWLSGNQLGPPENVLPPALAARLAAGKLNYWYDPNAPQLSNSALLLTVAALFTLPALLAALGQRWLARREQALQQAAALEGQVFPIPGFLRGTCLWLVLIIVLLDIFILVAGLNSERTRFTLQAGILIPLLLAPGLALGLWMLVHNSGLALLTAAELIVRRPWGWLTPEQRLALADLAEVRETVGLIPWDMAACSAQPGCRRILIPRFVERRPTLYAALLQWVPEKAAPGRNTPAKQTALTGRLYRIRRGEWWVLMGGMILIVVFWVGVGLLPIWQALVEGGKLERASWLAAGLLFVLLGVFMLPLLYVAWRTLFGRRGPLEIDQPNALEVDAVGLRYRLPGGPWHERPAAELQRIELRP
jgi:hypothetical protein